jgi:hypothetical protein
MRGGIGCGAIILAAVVLGTIVYLANGGEGAGPAKDRDEDAAHSTMGDSPKRGNPNDRNGDGVFDGEDVALRMQSEESIRESIERWNYGRRRCASLPEGSLQKGFNCSVQDEEAEHLRELGMCLTGTTWRKCG